MKQFFVLGRNPELSRQEIISYMDARELEFKEILFKENFLILDCPELNIQELGGAVKSGRLIFSGNIGELKKFIDSDEVIPEEKFSYSVFGNFSDLEDMLIDKFKSEGKKAMIRRGQRGFNIHVQEGEPVSIPKSDFQIFCFFHNEIYLGLVEKSFDYEDVRKRDMKKPVRREELAISPRLARILINLSGARPGKLMLDPFCGIGAVLQEALVSGINVVGLDIDKKAISDCTRNLKWLEKNYKIAEWQLLNEDSRRVPDKKYDAVAGETPLGVLVRKRPNNFEAKEIISKFEGFIVHILRRLKNVKKVDGKIAITFPFIREYSVNIDKVCNETGLKCLFRVKEYRSSQFIGREILVFA